MAHITLRVLDGADRGKVYRDLLTPVTIGREEGNSIQLNDERISRFHIKIQEDQERLVLTDLDSTNGTRVNGEDSRMRILRFGDVICLGRSMLLFGTRDQIAKRLGELRANGLASESKVDAEKLAEKIDSSGLDFELQWGASEDLHSSLHIPSPPELPANLGPGQAAQLSEVLEYLHLRCRALIQSVKLPESARSVHFDTAKWQSLLELHAQLAEYLRLIGEPDEE